MAHKQYIYTHKQLDNEEANNNPKQAWLTTKQEQSN